MNADATPPLTGERYLEDHAVGDVIVSAPFTFAADLVNGYASAVDDHSEVHDPEVPGASVHGALIHGALVAWLVRDGHVSRVRAELDHTWHYDRPVLIGETVSFRVTFTRIVRSRGLNNGLVHRTLEVLNADNEVLQHATSRILVQARHAVDDSQSRVATALGTPPWAQLLADRLAKDEVFTLLTSTWDGTIGLAFGDDTVMLRVYKGQLLEATRRTPHGPTFTVHASELTWTRLVTGPTNDFTRRAMQGEISMTGNAYEYLRLNRTVVGIVDVIRAIAEEDE